MDQRFDTDRKAACLAGPGALSVLVTGPSVAAACNDVGIGK